MRAAAVFGRRAGLGLAVLAGVALLAVVLTLHRPPSYVALDSLDDATAALIHRTAQPLPFRRHGHADLAGHLAAERAVSYQQAQRELAKYDQSMPPVDAAAFSPEDHLDAHANLWLTGSGSSASMDQLDTDAQKILGHARPSKIVEPRGLREPMHLKSEEAHGTPEGQDKSEAWKRMRGVLDGLQDRIGRTGPVPGFVRPRVAFGDVAPVAVRAAGLKAAAARAVRASPLQQKYHYYPSASPLGRVAWDAYHDSPEGRAAWARYLSPHYGSGFNPFGVSSASQIPGGLFAADPAVDRAVRAYMAGYHHAPEPEHAAGGYGPAAAAAVLEHNARAAMYNAHIASGDGALEAGYSPAVAAAIRAYMDSRVSRPAPGVGPVPTHRGGADDALDGVRAARIRQLEREAAAAAGEFAAPTPATVVPSATVAPSAPQQPLIYRPVVVVPPPPPAAPVSPPAERGPGWSLTIPGPISVRFPAGTYTLTPPADFGATGNVSEAAAEGLEGSAESESDDDAVLDKSMLDNGVDQAAVSAAAEALKRELIERLTEAAESEEGAESAAKQPAAAQLKTTNTQLPSSAAQGDDTVLSWAMGSNAGIDRAAVHAAAQDLFERMVSEGSRAHRRAARGEESDVLDSRRETDSGVDTDAVKAAANAAAAQSIASASTEEGGAALRHGRDAEESDVLDSRRETDAGVDADAVKAAAERYANEWIAASGAGESSGNDDDDAVLSRDMLDNGVDHSAVASAAASLQASIVEASAAGEKQGNGAQAQSPEVGESGAAYPPSVHGRTNEGLAMQMAAMPSVPLTDLSRAGAVSRKAATQMLADTMLMPINIDTDLSDKFNAPLDETQEKEDMEEKDRWAMTPADKEAEIIYHRKMDRMAAHVQRQAKPEDAGAWWSEWWEHPDVGSVVAAVEKDVGAKGEDDGKEKLMDEGVNLDGWEPGRTRWQVWHDQKTGQQLPGGMWDMEGNTAGSRKFDIHHPCGSPLRKRPCTGEEKSGEDPPEDDDIIWKDPVPRESILPPKPKADEGEDEA